MTDKMDKKELSPFENDLASLRLASPEGLAATILEALRAEELHSMRHRVTSAVDILFGEEFGEERKLLARLTLEDVLAGPPTKPTSMPTVQTKKKEPSAGKPFNSLQFVGFLVLAVAVIYFKWQEQRDLPLFDMPEKPVTPAVMTDLADVQWKSTPPKLGEPLQPGRLAFGSGTVELLFFNGVRSVIEGPAELALLTEGRVFCNQGKWSVTVPPSGIGFEIQTPGGTIRDLGTQFYASIEGKDCGVHVLKGIVEVENGKKTLLQTNEAINVQGGEIRDRMASVVNLFVPKTEMRQRSTTYWQQNPPPSVQAKTEPILSVDFRQENPDDVTLFSVRRVPGCSPERTAVRLDGADSRIRLKSLGKLSSFTVVINLKIDRLRGGPNPILMSEGMKSGGIVWNITPSGTMVCGFQLSTAGHSETFETPLVFTKELLGQWVQLGLCVDKGNGRMSVYLNGDPICSQKLPSRGVQDLSGLDVAAWKLGNDVCPLDGAVDSITVFDRCLELQEIRTP